MNSAVLGLAILVVLNLAMPYMRDYTTTSSSVTYTKDVKPIFQKHCSSCHTPTWADKNWMDYETAKKHMGHIKHRVSNETMPPGNITNMTKEERKMVIDWVDGGGKK